MVAAQLSAVLLANLNPKLHRDIKTSLENSSSSAAVDVDSMMEKSFAAFCHSYIDAGSKFKPFIEGSIGMLLLAIALLSNSRFIIVSICTLIFGCLWCVSFTHTMKEYAENRLKMPDKCDQVIVYDKDQENSKSVIRHVLKLDNPEQFTRDADCVALAQMMGSMVRFQLEHYKVSYFMDDDEKPDGSGKKTLVAVAGKHMPEGLAELSVRELGERLSERVSKMGQDFCQAYFQLRRLLTKDIVFIQNQIEIREALKNSEPLDEDKLKKRLKLDEVRKATRLIAADHSGIVEEAQLFLHNVYRSSKLSSQVDAIMEEINDHEKKFDEKIVSIQTMQLEEAKLMGALACFKKKKDNMKSARGGMQELLGYYEKQLARVNQDIEKAAADEKNYTWWMYGFRTHVWENDVALAKAKIKRYGDEKVELERLIGDIKSHKADHVQTLDKEMEQIEEKTQRKTTDLENLRHNLVSKEKEAKALEQTITNLKAKVESIVQGEGKESVKHLFLARQALNDFAHVAKASAALSTMTIADWQQDLLAIIDQVEDVLEAPSLKDQKTMLWKFQKILSREKIPVVAMIQKTNAKFTLTPNPELYTKYFDVHSEVNVSVEKRIEDSRKKCEQKALADEHVSVD